MMKPETRTLPEKDEVAGMGRELSRTGTGVRGQMSKMRCGETHEVKPLAKPSGELSCSCDPMRIRMLLEPDQSLSLLLHLDTSLPQTTSRELCLLPWVLWSFRWGSQVGGGCLLPGSQ